jgi:dynein heavy chain 2
MEVINNANIQEAVLISSIIDSPIDSFYRLVHDIYSPILSSNKNKTPYDSRLINNLADLDQNLKSAMRLDDSRNKTADSPIDEFYYWQEKSKQAAGASSSANSVERERADAYYKHFLPLFKHYENIQTANLLELVDLIEYTQDVYDDVWKQLDFDNLYPQDRMANLLEVTGLIFQSSYRPLHTQ